MSKIVLPRRYRTDEMSAADADALRRRLLAQAVITQEFACLRCGKAISSAPSYVRSREGAAAAHARILANRVVAYCKPCSTRPASDG